MNILSLVRDGAKRELEEREIEERGGEETRGESVDKGLKLPLSHLVINLSLIC